MTKLLSQCPECGAVLPPAKKNGRPRIYCNHACSNRAYKRRQAIQAKMTEAEKKVAAVWADDAKRVEWWCALKAHERLLAETISKWNAIHHDLPLEMSDKTREVIPLESGENAYRFKSPLEGIAWTAVAELVHDYPPEEITDARVRNRVKDRLTDALRYSEEYEYASTGDDGTKRRATRRKAMPTRRYATQDRTSDRGTEAVNREEKMRELLETGEPWEHLMALLFIMADRAQSSTLAGLFNVKRRQRGLPLLSEADLRAVAVDGPRDPIGVIHWFFDWKMPPEEVDAILWRALAKLDGAEELSDSLDEGPEVPVPSSRLAD